MTLVMTLYYLGEELGWRGYLQVQAAPGRPLLAAALTGLIWGLWHYPLILVGFPGYEDKWALLIHPINSVFISIFMGWLRERSQSVWPACLAHAVDNSIASGLLSMMLPGVSALVAWGGYGMAGYAALSLLVLLLGPFRTSASLEPAEGHPMTGSYRAAHGPGPRPGCPGRRGSGRAGRTRCLNKGLRNQELVDRATRRKRMVWFEIRFKARADLRWSD